MTDEKNRRERELILARRRFFVASALAGVVTTACTPRPCLNVAEPPGREPDEGGVPEATGGNAGTTGATDPDAGVDPVGTADPEPIEAGTLPPTVCLKVTPPPPHVCLEFAEPPEKNTK